MNNPNRPQGTPQTLGAEPGIRVVTLPELQRIAQQELDSRAALLAECRRLVAEDKAAAGDTTETTS